MDAQRAASNSTCNPGLADRGYSDIFHNYQRFGFWPDPDSPGSHKEDKKKDHQNRTIISEMAAISVPSKVLFLWTIVQVESPGSLKTCLNPYLGPPKLVNIIQKHEISF